MITQQEIKEDLLKISKEILGLRDSELMEVFTCNEYEKVFTSERYLEAYAEPLAVFLGMVYCKEVLKIPYRLCFIHASIGKVGGVNMSYDDLLNLCDGRRKFAQWIIDNSERLSKDMSDDKTVKGVVDYL